MFGKNSVSPVAPPNHSQINEDVRIRGTITVSEPLVMAGQLDGDINADTLHITSDGDYYRRGNRAERNN